MAIIAKGTMKQDDKTANQQQNQPVAPQVGAAPVGTAQQGTSVQSQQTPKANIQSFTAANKEGTERIGSALKTGLNRDVNVQQKQTDTSVQNVRNAVDAANKNAQLGQQYLQQVNTPTQGFQSGLAQQPSKYVAPQAPQPQGPAGVLTKPTEQQAPAYTRPEYQDVGFKDTVFDAKSLADDADKLKQFTGLRTGETQAADKAAQEKALQDAALAKDKYKQFTQTRLEQLRNNQAEGQDALLQDYLGKYMQNYTKGQSALDKSLLRLDKNNTLSQAKQDLRQRQATDISKATQDIEQQKQSVAANLEQTKTLKDDLQNAITQKVAEYEKLVGNDERLAAANKYRADEIAYLEDQLGKLGRNEAIQRNFAEEIGLDPNDIVYHGVQESLDNLYNVDRTDLSSANQIATEAERAKVDALYRLAGLDPSAQKIRLADKSTVDPTQLVGNIDNALKFAEDKFLTTAAGKNIYGDAYTNIKNNPSWMYGYYTDKNKTVKDYLDNLASRNVDTYKNVNASDVDKKFAGYTAYNPYIDRFTTWDEDQGRAIMHGANGQTSGISQSALDKGQELSINDLTNDLNAFLSQQGRFNRVKYE